MKSFNRITLHAVFALTAGIGALSANSARAEGQDPPTKVVHFADLNINDTAGAKVLYRRIRSAAVEVCQTLLTTDLHYMGRERVCVDKAIDDAVRKVGSPTLSALRFGGDIRMASK